MKRSMLYAGIGYVLAGIVFAVLAAATEFALTPLFWGLAGAGIGPGAVMIWKYRHWSRPDRRERYEQQLKQEQIELHDERKIMLRDRSGATVFRLFLIIYPILMFLCAVLSALEIGTPFTRQLILFLLALELIQYFLGWAVFSHLEKKL